MTVCVLITAEWEATVLSKFGCHFARAGEEPLILIYPDADQKKKPLPDSGNSSHPIHQKISLALAEYQQQAAAQTESSLQTRIESISPADTAHAALEIVKKEKAGLLLLGNNEGSKTKSLEYQMAQYLFNHATCDTILLRFSATDQCECDRILVPTAGGPHANSALRLAGKLSSCLQSKVTPLYINNQSSELAQEVGQLKLKKILSKLKLTESEEITPRVVINSNTSQAISQTAAENFDLLLIGASNSGMIRRTLFGTVPDRLLKEGNGLVIGLMRSARPLADRLYMRFERWLDLTIPQFDREDRIQLFEQLESGSRWNFDFAALILLSTAIAALGLIGNSTSVVIGAMLVAPLMLPLLGAGLALVQGNRPLIRNSFTSITLGFLFALAVSLLIGLLVPLQQLTPEILARGGPTLLDMAIAFLSGLAAAYCIGRPNLSAALPGVAIAAALVPPIAAAGAALAVGETATALGALTLFGTNVVAIIFGAALSLFASGARERRSEKPVKGWVLNFLILLGFIFLILTVPLGGSTFTQFYRRSATPIISSALKESIAAKLVLKAISLQSVRVVREQNMQILELQILAQRRPGGRVLKELENIAAPFFKSKFKVRILTQLQIESEGVVDNQPPAK